MISTKIDVKLDTTKLKKLVEVLSKYSQASVSIGIHQGTDRYQDSNVTVIEVALWNEFGTKKIPERSFFRSTLAENESKIKALQQTAIENILEKNWSVDQALDYIGFNIQVMIQNKIKSNVPPPYGSGRKPNDADTIEKAQAAKLARGHAPVTLIESGIMLRHITYRKNLK